MRVNSTGGYPQHKRVEPSACSPPSSLFEGMFSKFRHLFASQVDKRNYCLFLALNPSVTCKHGSPTLSGLKEVILFMLRFSCFLMSFLNCWFRSWYLAFLSEASFVNGKKLCLGLLIYTSGNIFFLSFFNFWEQMVHRERFSGAKSKLTTYQWNMFKPLQIWVRFFLLVIISRFRICS